MAHKSRNTINLTPSLAHAAGTDAANRQMRAANRTCWSDEDFSLAVGTTNKLMLLIPFELGGLGGLQLRHSMLKGLGVTVQQVIETGGSVLGRDGRLLLKAA